MQQIKDSPDINADRPVSRQMETELYDYYGWYPYWGSGLYMGGYGYMGSFGLWAAPDGGLPRRPGGAQQRIADTQRNDGDPHLRSIAAVTGYHIHASDGEVGHVEDFLLDDTDWSIHLPGRRYEELVARQEGPDIATVGAQYRLEDPGW